MTPHRGLDSAPDLPSGRCQSGERITGTLGSLEALKGFNPFWGEAAVGGGVRDLLGNSNDILSDILAAGALREEKAGW